MHDGGGALSLFLVGMCRTGFQKKGLHSTERIFFLKN